MWHCSNQLAANNILSKATSCDHLSWIISMISVMTDRKRALTFIKKYVDVPRKCNAFTLQQD